MFGRSTSLSRVIGSLELARRGSVAAVAGTVAVTAVGLPARAQDEGQPEFVRAGTIILDVTGVDPQSTDVLIDDAQVNAFATFEANRIVLRLPFTEAAKPFKVVVRTRQTNEERYAKLYAFPASALFDKVDVEGSFQNDTVYRPTSRVRPRPSNYHNSDVANDYRATGAATAIRQNWTAKFDGELVGTDDDNKTLRADGPKLDLSRGLGMLQYADPAGQINGRAFIGDVSVPGGVGLVNQGFSSRGMALELGLFGDAVTVSAGNVYGADIVGFQRGIEAYDEQNRRSALNVGVKVYNSQNLNVSIHGSVADVRRPGEASFGIGDVVDGESNTVWGGGLKIGAWQDRIRLTSEMSWSNYSNPATLNQVNEFGNSVDVGVTKDDAQSHRLEADLYQGEKLRVSTFGQYRLTGPLYMSTVAFAQADREIFDYGMTVGYDFVTVSLSRNMFDNNVDDVPSILKTRQRTNSARLEVALDSFKQMPEGETGFSARKLIPDTISLGRDDARVETLNSSQVVANSSIDPTEMPNQVTLTSTLSMAWNWSFGSTSLDLSRSTLDTRNVGRQTADTDDRSVAISQSFQGEGWNTSFRLGYGWLRNKEVTTMSTDRRYEAGVQLGVTPEKLPNLSAGFDVNTQKTAFDITGNSSLSNSWRFNAGLDFTKFLPQQVSDYQPYLRMAYQIQESDQRSPDFGSQSMISWALTFAAGFKF